MLKAGAAALCTAAATPAFGFAAAAPVAGGARPPRDQRRFVSPAVEQEIVRVADAPQEEGEFSNIAANQAPQRLAFARPHRGRYIEIAFTRTAKGETRLAIAELGVLTQ